MRRAVLQSRVVLEPCVQGPDRRLDPAFGFDGQDFDFALQMQEPPKWQSKLSWLTGQVDEQFSRRVTLCVLIFERVESNHERSKNISSNNRVARRQHADSMYASDWLQSNFTGRDLDQVLNMQPFQLMKRTFTSFMLRFDRPLHRPSFKQLCSL